MATAAPAYNPTIGGTTAPVVIDGTGLTTTVPLLIKNGKDLSGLELQVTGTAATGIRILDTDGTTLLASFGYATAISKWITGSAVGDLCITCPSNKVIRFGNAGSTVASVNTQTNTFNCTGVYTCNAGAPITNWAIQPAGDANTGQGQIGGADTYSAGAGGTEVWRIGNGTWGVFTKITAPAAQQTSGANLTNSVTSGGTDDTIANFTDLTIYANDAAAIRNDIYQLARKVKQVNDALRLFGWLT